VASNDLQVLQSFADQAAIAVHNAQLYEKIDQERRRLAGILDHSADGVMILAPNLRILHFNRALERMTGWATEDAIGSEHDTVITWVRLESNQDLGEAIAGDWLVHGDDNPLYVEGDLQCLNGPPLSIGITYAPMLTPEGKLANI